MNGLTTQEFLDHAFSIPELVEYDTIRCPCSICRNFFRHKRPRIELHLCHNGFKENYQTWKAHGERQGNQNLEIGSEVEHEGFGEIDRMDAMLVDLAGEHPGRGYRCILSCFSQPGQLGWPDLCDGMKYFVGHSFIFIGLQVMATTSKLEGHVMCKEVFWSSRNKCGFCISAIQGMCARLLVVK